MNYLSAAISLTGSIFLIASGAVFGDTRLSDVPLPQPLVSAGDCLNVATDGWGWDGTQSCRISTRRYEGESLPLVELSIDHTGNGLVWSRSDVAGKTVRCDSFKRNNYGQYPVGTAHPTEPVYRISRYDITFLDQDLIPADAAAENLSDVTAHLYTRGWDMEERGQLVTGLDINFRGYEFTTQRGYLIVQASENVGNNDDILTEFSHCYLRDESAPLRATGLCTDYDGDGVGWNGAEVCTVTQLDPDCDYSNAQNTFGWGYNAVTRQSCPPISNGAYEPVDECIQSFDGWGWNPARLESCRP